MLTIQRRMSRPFLILLALPATAMGFALSVQISVLSWILSTRYGLRLDEIGLVWAAGPLAGILGQLLVGFISDGVWFWGGRRRPFIIVGGLLSALMILTLPGIGLISKALGFETIVGVAIAVALGLDLSINVSFNPTRTIIADLTADDRSRTRGYAWMQTVSGVFGVLAYAIGAVFGNYVLIYVAAVVVLLFSIVPALLIVEPRVLPQASGGAGNGAQAQRPGIARLLFVLMPLWGLIAYDVIAMSLRLLGIQSHGYALELACGLVTAVVCVFTFAARDRGAEFVREDLVEFRKVLAAHAFSWLGVQTMFVYMISFVRQRFPLLGADSAGQVLSVSFLVLNAVGALMPAFILEPLTRRFGQLGTHASCLGVMAVGYLAVYAFGTTPPVLYTLMAVLGVGWAAIVSLPFAIMSERVESSRIGLYMGVFNLAVVVPQLVVSLGIGTLVERLQDKGAIFLIAAGSLSLSALGWLFVRRGVSAPVPVVAVAGGHAS